MDTDLTNSIHKTLFVPWLPQEAFHMFTNQIGEWWPLATHSLADKNKGEQATSAIIEPHAGGKVYEVLADGHTHKSWGEVLKYVPGQLLTLKWRVNCSGNQATEWEVIFSPAGQQTKIDLLHRGWESFGAEAEDMKQKYDKGWDFVLAQFISFAKTHEAA